MKRSYRISKAFTLLETLIALAVMSIAISVIFYAFSASMRIFTEELSESDASFEAHRSMDRMTKELRHALQIVASSSSGITFWYQDINDNGTREANETVAFSWTGTSDAAINRTVNGASVRIAGGIVNFSLSYDNPSDIKAVTIILTSKKGTVLSTLESSVKSRNL